MKNILRLLLLFSCQTIFAQRLEVALHGGSGAAAYHNFFQLRKTEYIGTRALPSHYASVGLRYRLNKQFSVEQELGFAKMGGGRYYMTRESRYWQQQLSLRFDFLPYQKGRLNRYARAGLYIGKLEQQEVKYSSSRYADDCFYYIEMSEIKRRDWGATGALGAMVLIRSPLSMSVELRAARGFKNLPTYEGVGNLYNMAVWGLVGFHVMLF